MAKRPFDYTRYQSALGRLAPNDREGCINLIRSYDFSQREKGADLFAGRIPLYSLTDDDVDLSSITSARHMFTYNQSIENISLSLPDCTDFNSMFCANTNLKKLYLYIPGYTKAYWEFDGDMRNAEYNIVTGELTFERHRLPNSKFLVWIYPNLDSDKMRLVEFLSVSGNGFSPTEWWDSRLEKFRMLYVLGKTGVDSVEEHCVCQEFLKDMYIRRCV